MTTVFKVPVTITTGPAKGHRFMVAVPPEDYTPDGVRRHIDTWIHAHHSVAGISSDNA